MGLIAQTMEAGAPVDSRRKCGVCEWVATLDDEDRVSLERLMELAGSHADGWDYSKLHRLCKDAGLTLGLPRFTTHAKGQCGRNG